MKKHIHRTRRACSTGKETSFDKKDRQHLLLSYIEEDATIAVTRKICSMDMRAVDRGVTHKNCT